MGYDKNPPAPARFLDPDTVLPPVPVALRWPTIADLVCARTVDPDFLVKHP